MAGFSGGKLKDLKVRTIVVTWAVRLRDCRRHVVAFRLSVVQITGYIGCTRDVPVVAALC